MEELKLVPRSEIVEVSKPFENLKTLDFELGSANGPRFDIVEKENFGKVIILKAGRQEYQTTVPSVDAACRTIGIPVSYAKKCPSEMLIPHLNYWFGSPILGKVRFFIENDTIVGCTASQGQHHTNLEILGEIEKAIGVNSIIGFQNNITSLDHSIFSVITDRIFEANSGDILHGGIEVQNSIDGSKTLQISPFIFRQVCSNGMIAAEHISNWKRNSSENFGMWTQNVARSSMGRLDNEFGQIKRLQEVALTGEVHALNTLRSIFRKYMISVKTQKEIAAEVLVSNTGNGANSMYDIWNAITRVGTHSPTLTATSSRDLRIIAGKVSREVSLCPHCDQLIGDC